MDNRETLSRVERATGVTFGWALLQCLFGLYYIVPSRPWMKRGPSKLKETCENRERSKTSTRSRSR